MRPAFFFTPFVASLGLAVAAAAPADKPSKAAEKGVSVLHWWTSSGELAALEALGQEFKKKHPDIPLNIVDSRSHGGGARMFAAARAAADARVPHDAIHVNGGATLRPYLDAALLAPLDQLWKDEGLDKVVPPMIKAISQIGGRYYAVPIDVHRNNLLWYNKPVLDKHGIDPRTLTTWSKVFEAAEKMKVAGLRHPLQIGVAWTLSVTLEGIIAGMGAETYSAWVNGEITEPDDPRLLESLAVLDRYVSYSNPDHASTGWDAAIQRLIRGGAALCVMGDWANGEFRLAKLTYGKDYGAIPLPGTQGMYGAAVDLFAQSRATVNPASSDHLLRVIVSRAGQEAFNARKGSIPPRMDTGLSGYDTYQKSAIADFKAAKVIYPNIVSATHDAFKIGIDNAMAAFATDRDVKKAAAAIATLAARSQNKFSHVWSHK
jgi:glucose/mannose transport system substrate-binding protein